MIGDSIMDSVINTSSVGVENKLGKIYVDNLHLTAYVADMMARLVAEQLEAKTTGLEDYINIS